jgi:VWFA-related protein
MRHALGLTVFVLGFAMSAASAPEEDITFKSEVSLARVDVQVVDRQNRAITGLEVEDFILRDSGEMREIKNFLAEEMPVDVLLLIDVSGSMQSHVRTIADAAHQALNVLAEGDRVAIMVFDRSTRVRLPFNQNRRQVLQALDGVVSQEGFNGGTDITRAFYDAIRFVARDARRDARRAIVILTDDQTERDRDENGITAALTKSDVIASALLAPDAMGIGGMGGGGRTRTGGGWPGSTGGGIPDIIFGRRDPWGTRTPFPGGGSVGRTHSAGTAEIAERSGGDSMSVDDASAFEMTLTRIRQRYALHYNMGELVNAADRGDNIEVDLSSAASRRYPGAEVRFRRVYMNSDGDMRGTEIRTASRTTRTQPAPRTADPELSEEDTPRLKRRPAVSEPDGSRSSGPAISAPDPGAQQRQGGWRQSDEPEAEPAKPVETDKSKQSKSQEAQQRQGGGWRRVQPGEEP